MSQPHDSPVPGGRPTYADFRWDVHRYRDPWAREPSERLPHWSRDVPIVLRRTELWAIAEHRLARRLRSGPPALRAVSKPLLAVLHVIAESLSGSVISHHADVGPGLYIAHGQGVVIGGTSTLGTWCDVYQGATLGMRGDGRFPTLGDGVYLAPHAVVAGGITVGDRARIGPNVSVVRDVRAGTVLVQATPRDTTVPDQEVETP